MHLQDQSLVFHQCFFYGRVSEGAQNLAQVVKSENEARDSCRLQDEADIFARLHPGRQVVLPSLPVEPAAAAGANGAPCFSHLHAQGYTGLIACKLCVLRAQGAPSDCSLIGNGI